MSDYNKFEDRAFKIMAMRFLTPLFNLFELHINVKNILPTELVLYSKSFNMDFLIETTEGYLINLEFQSTKINVQDMLRFHMYAILAYHKYGKKVYTIVISTSKEREESIIIEHFGLCSLFTIHVLSFNDLELEKALNDINNKIKNNIQLNEDDIVKITLIPFMDDRENIQELLEWSCNILTNIEMEDKEDFHSIQAIETLLINKFVKDENLKNKLLDVIEMSDNVIFERYAKPYFEKGIIEGEIKGKKEGIIEGEIKGKKEGIIEGKKEGIIEGKNEGIDIGKKEKEKEFVNRLLDVGYSLDEISFLTGLSIDEINNLKR